MAAASLAFFLLQEKSLHPVSGRTYSLEQAWSILVYRIPSQPSRLRLQVWRKLQSVGALYLQDAVCVLPSRPDQEDPLREVAESIREFGGSAHLFAASLAAGFTSAEICEGFRAMADERNRTILSRIQGALHILEKDVDMADIEVAEESLMRERIAFLRAQRLAYFGGSLDHDVEGKLEELRVVLDEIRAAMLS
jgi:DNA-binding transcriptional regulator PaaX